jgi:sensor domain CHASE-containing protein
MVIFFLVWKISAHVSTMNIVLLGIISAFIFPRLYISNKDIVDAHIQKGQTMIQSGIQKAQSAATDAVNHSYTKSRFFFAKVGTTGTDAKNTLQKSSAVLKED